MGRTRAGLLEGAVRGIEKYGSHKVTMADIASLGGISKATLYNHFRTKRDLYAALVDTEVETLVRECTDLAVTDLPGALAHAATRVADHRAVRRIASAEPAVLGVLAAPTPAGAWPRARAGISDALGAAGYSAEPAAVESVLRWVASFLLAPDTADACRAQAGVLVAGLPRAQDLSSPEPSPEGSPEPSPGAVD